MFFFFQCDFYVNIFLYYRNIYLLVKILQPTYDHGRKCYTSDETDSDWCSHQSSKLPKDFFLSRPRFFTPKCATRRTASKIKECLNVCLEIAYALTTLLKYNT